MKKWLVAALLTLAAGAANADDNINERPDNGPDEERCAYNLPPEPACEHYTRVELDEACNWQASSADLAVNFWDREHDALTCHASRVNGHGRQLPQRSRVSCEDACHESDRSCVTHITPLDRTPPRIAVDRPFGVTFELQDRWVYNWHDVRDVCQIRWTDNCANDRMIRHGIIGVRSTDWRDERSGYGSPGHIVMASGLNADWAGFQLNLDRTLGAVERAYTFTYAVIDESGNQSEAECVVHVVEPKPELKCGEGDDIGPWDGRVIFVDADAMGANDGSSWADAYSAVQDGLAAASPGDEIRVAQGTYRPDEGTGQMRGDREAAFKLTGHLKLCGGYAGFGEPDPGARDVDAYLTILSGDLNGDDGPDFANNEENSIHVTTCGDIQSGSFYGENTQRLLDGFTITGGNATYQDPEWSYKQSRGGGMLCEHRTTVSNCRFLGNWAERLGGAVANFAYWGMKITDSTFVENSAEGGGGLGARDAPTWVDRCAFFGNSAHRREYDMFAMFHRVGGGAIMTESDFGSLDLSNSVLSGNSTTDDGGAIFFGPHGGGHSVANCTVIDNVAGRHGGGIYKTDYYAYPDVVNSILSNNSDSDGVYWWTQLYRPPSYEKSIGDYGSHNCIQDWDIERGPENRGLDPKFVDAAGADGIVGTEDDDLRLQPDSPCIDVGNPTHVAGGWNWYYFDDYRVRPPRTTDFFGNPRVINSAVDIGAIELQDPTAWIGEECATGLGVCQRTGKLIYSNDGLNLVVCSAPPVVEPSHEVCNGIDDDCDGRTDEGCNSCPVETLVMDGWACIPPGEFVMGSPGPECPQEDTCIDPRCDDGECPDPEPGRWMRERQHRVHITRPFLLKNAEVTQGEWQSLMGTQSSCFEECGDDCPVDCISWNDAIAYCNALSNEAGLPRCYADPYDGTDYGPEDAEAGKTPVWRDGLDCPGYRMPTEAEWEYAARAETQGAYYGPQYSSSRERIAWHARDTFYIEEPGLHPVRLKRENPWGLWDVFGNVQEFVWDYASDDSGEFSHPAEAVVDPTGPQWGRARIQRGGMAAHSAVNIRAAYAESDDPWVRGIWSGFRPARSVVEFRDPASRLGEACAIGLGACRRTGELIYSPDGPSSITCDVPHAEPGPERCNGIDDDCDGELDEGCDGCPMETEMPNGWICIPAGELVMGSPGAECPYGPCIDPRCKGGLCPEQEEHRRDDEAQHRVYITQPFLLKATEVTQGEWRDLMGSNPSTFVDCGDDCPVESVTWFEAVTYCNALSDDTGLASCYADPDDWTDYDIDDAWAHKTPARRGGCAGFRLPTEAEWEYAARAGTSGPYLGDFDDVAWYSGDGTGTTHPVSQKESNAWGLHDMLGNVWEWASDGYAIDYGGFGDPTVPVMDPAGPAVDSLRTTRGGGWASHHIDLRTAARFARQPDSRENSQGFRVAMSVVELHGPAAPVGEACALGVGACRRTGELVYASNDLNLILCDALPGEPRNEACNGIDDDCDGDTDEGCTDCPLDGVVMDGWVCISPGEFVMGSPGPECPDGACIDPRCYSGECPESEEDRGRDEFQHRVHITQPFLLKATEVTQGEWRSLMGNNPSDFAECGDDCPVVSINWYETVTYCNALSSKVGLTSCYGDPDDGTDYDLLDALRYKTPTWRDGCGGFRLPTEAEWEYAARAGTAEANYGDPDDIGWHGDNSARTIHPVGLKLPNGWQLFDMYGNAAELVWDLYAEHYWSWGNRDPNRPVADPVGPAAGRYRVDRGEAWFYPPHHLRAASRGRSAPHERYYATGFRPAKSYP